MLRKRATTSKFKKIMALVLALAMAFGVTGLMGLDLPTIRTDVFVDEAEISAWAQEAVNALYEAGIISGVGDNRFNPRGYGTRAQVATLLRNFMDAVQFGPFAATTDDYAMLRDEDLYYDRREEEAERALAGNDEEDNGADNDNTN